MLGWGPASFVALFVLSLRRLIMRDSSGSSCSVGLRIEGRPAEESVSGKTSGRLGSPTAVVAGVFPVGYLPPPGSELTRLTRLTRLGIPVALNI